MNYDDPGIDRNDDRGWMLGLIRKIVERAPVRPPAGEGELVAQKMVEDEFTRQGIRTSWHGFRFHRSIYGDLALHCGLAVVGTAVSVVLPVAAAILHAFAAFSYGMQSTRRHAVVRRLYRQRKSQNLAGVIPAANCAAPRLRLVFLGHADAAYYGFVFSKHVVRNTMYAPWPLNRMVALAVWLMAAMVPFDLARLIFDHDLVVVRIIEWVITFPAMFGFFLNADVFLRNRHVPGANDNLSACAALPVLAKRLAPDKPDDVELVFAVTGCEEAGLGGAIGMADYIEGRWDRGNTVFLCMDGMSNGQLRYVAAEGELFYMRPDRKYVDIVRDVAASRPGFKPWEDVGPYEIAIGGTDMAAFLARGWKGISFVCIDPATGSPRHYHTPDDDPDHLDGDELINSIDFMEQVAKKIMADR